MQQVVLFVEGVCAEEKAIGQSTVVGTVRVVCGRGGNVRMSGDRRRGGPADF
jgi:hypothetical protein